MKKPYLYLIATASAIFAAGTLITPTAQAGTIGIHYIETSMGYTHMRQNSDNKTDMETFCATANYSIFGDEAPLLYLDIRGKYEYSRSGKNDLGERDEHHFACLEAVLGISIFDFITPHVFAGGAYNNFDLQLESEKNSGTEFGGTVGAGIQFEFIPSVFKVTPYARYTEFESLTTTRYGVDTSFWFTWFGVGAELSYTNHDNPDFDSFQATAYVGFRF